MLHVHLLVTCYFCCTNLRYNCLRAIWLNSYARVYMYLHVYVYIYMYMCVCVCVCMYIYMHMHAHMYVCICICMYVYTYIRHDQISTEFGAITF
jgi:hypothetical protein